MAVDDESRAGAAHHCVEQAHLREQIQRLHSLLGKMERSADKQATELEQLRKALATTDTGNVFDWWKEHGQTREALRSELIIQLSTEIEQLRMKCDLQSAALLMVGSELCADPKIDPANTSDPRWTPTLEKASAVRLELEQLRSRVAFYEGRLAAVDSQRAEVCATPTASTPPGEPSEPDR